MLLITRKLTHHCPEAMTDTRNHVSIYQARVHHCLLATMSSESSSSTSNTKPITFTISFRGTPHVVSDLSSSSTLSELHLRLEDLTGVSPSLQKLLYKGKKTTWTEGADRVTLAEAGLKDGMKVQLLGSTTKELEGMKKEEGEHQRKERIMRERALKAPVKVRKPNGLSSETIVRPKNSFRSGILPHHLRPPPSNTVSITSRPSNTSQTQHLPTRFFRNSPTTQPSHTSCTSTISPSVS